MSGLGLSGIKNSADSLQRGSAHGANLVRCISTSCAAAAEGPGASSSASSSAPKPTTYPTAQAAWAASAAARTAAAASTSGSASSNTTPPFPRLLGFAGAIPFVSLTPAMVEAVGEHRSTQLQGPSACMGPSWHGMAAESAPLWPRSCNKRERKLADHADADHALHATRGSQSGLAGGGSIMHHASAPPMTSCTQRACACMRSRRLARAGRQVRASAAHVRWIHRVLPWCRALGLGDGQHAM